MTEEVAAACSALMRCSDDVLIALFARAPLASRRAICASSRRLHAIVNSAGFVEERRPFAESVLVVAGGFRSELLHASDDCWMLRGERWRRTARLLDARTWACATVFEGELWVVGGYNDRHLAAPPLSHIAPRAERPREPGTFVAALDCRTGEWRRRPPLAERRTNAVCGVVGGRLVVAGGQNHDDPAGERPALASVAAYCPGDGCWTALPPLPRAVEQATACVVDGRLYVAGGADSDALQVFDGAAWSLRARLPARRFGAASAACDGKLMVIGGRVLEAAGDGPQDTTTVLLYDPARDRWEPGAPLPAPRFQCRACAHRGQIVVIGGSEGEPPCAYRDGAWRPFSLPSIPRASGFSCEDDTPSRYVYAPGMGSVVLG